VAGVAADKMTSCGTTMRGQRRDVGQILADLVVMAEDLEPIAVGVERRAGLGRERLNLAMVMPRTFAFVGDVIDRVGTRCDRGPGRISSSEP